MMKQLLPKVFAFIIFIFSAVVFVFWGVAGAEAARLYIDPAQGEINVGDHLEVGLFLDTQEETINAVQAAIAFPKELLELKEIRDGLSIVNFWVEKPSAVTPCTDACRVILSGITPGGYQGPGGLIFSLLLRAVKEGEGSIEIQDAQALLHDGEGTSAKLLLAPGHIRIGAAVSGPETSVPSVPDTEPPEAFTISVAQDANVFDGAWFAVFYAQDKQSGVDRYEVYESRDRYDLNEAEKKSLPWVSAEMPYRLQDQSRQSYVYMKAVDRAGNERIAIAPPQELKGEASPSYYYVVLAMGIAAAPFAYLAVKKIKKRVAAKRTL